MHRDGFIYSTPVLMGKLIYLLQWCPKTNSALVTMWAFGKQVQHMLVDVMKWFIHSACS